MGAYDVHRARLIGKVAPKTGIVPFMELRRGRLREVRDVIDRLVPEDLTRTCDHNPVAGFPPSTMVPIRFCLDLVIGEEWAHHEFATRDLAVLESR